MKTGRRREDGGEDGDEDAHDDADEMKMKMKLNAEMGLAQDIKPMVKMNKKKKFNLDKTEYAD